MTGITRERAAEVAAEYLGGEVKFVGGTYRTYLTTDRQGRKWKFTFDSSIDAYKRERGTKVAADDTYRTEMVTPICQYKDIPVIQELVRQLRHNGAFSNKSCGLHVHVSAAPFDARTLRNLTNIMYSKEDLLYRALQVEVVREDRYCQKTDQQFIDELNRRRPKSLEELSRIWYQGASRSREHYDKSRYRGVNLHSVFRNGTIEYRLYNSTVEHAGKIKAYIQLLGHHRPGIEPALGQPNQDRQRERAVHLSHLAPADGPHRRRVRHGPKASAGEPGRQYCLAGPGPSAPPAGAACELCGAKAGR